MFVSFFRHCCYDFFQTKCEHFDAYLLYTENFDNDWHKSGFKVNKYARTGSVVKMFTAQFCTIKMLFLSDNCHYFLNRWKRINFAKKFKLLSKFTIVFVITTASSKALNFTQVPLMFSVLKTYRLNCPIKFIS